MGGDESRGYVLRCEGTGWSRIQGMYGKRGQTNEGDTLRNTATYSYGVQVYWVQVQRHGCEMDCGSDEDCVMAPSVSYAKCGNAKGYWLVCATTMIQLLHILPTHSMTQQHHIQLYR